MEKCHIIEFEQTFLDKKCLRIKMSVKPVATFWRRCLFCDIGDLWLKRRFCHNLLIFDTIGWQVGHFSTFPGHFLIFLTSRVICHPIYRCTRIYTYLFIKLCFQFLKLSPNVGVSPSRWIMMVRPTATVRFAIDAIRLRCRSARRSGRSVTTFWTRLDSAHLDRFAINLKKLLSGGLTS